MIQQHGLDIGFVWISECVRMSNDFVLKANLWTIWARLSQTIRAIKMCASEMLYQYWVSASMNLVVVLKSIFDSNTCAPSFPVFICLISMSTFSTQFLFANEAISLFYRVLNRNFNFIHSKHDSVSIFSTVNLHDSSDLSMLRHVAHGKAVR